MHLGKLIWFRWTILKSIWSVLILLLSVPYKRVDADEIIWVKNEWSVRQAFIRRFRSPDGLAQADDCCLATRVQPSFTGPRHSTITLTPFSSLSHNQHHHLSTLTLTFAFTARSSFFSGHIFTTIYISHFHLTLTFHIRSAAPSARGVVWHHLGYTYIYSNFGTTVTTTSDPLNCKSEPVQPSTMIL